MPREAARGEGPVGNKLAGILEQWGDAGGLGFGSWQEKNNKGNERQVSSGLWWPLQ